MNIRNSLFYIYSITVFAISILTSVALADTNTKGVGIRISPTTTALIKESFRSYQSNKPEISEYLRKYLEENTYLIVSSGRTDLYFEINVKDIAYSFLADLISKLSSRFNSNVIPLYLTKNSNGLSEYYCAAIELGLLRRHIYLTKQIVEISDIALAVNKAQMDIAQKEISLLYKGVDPNILYFIQSMFGRQDGKVSKAELERAQKHLQARMNEIQEQIDAIEIKKISFKSECATFAFYYTSDPRKYGNDNAITVYVVQSDQYSFIVNIE